MKKLFVTIFSLLLVVTAACSDDPENNNGDNGGGPITSSDLVEQNLLRAMQMVDSAVVNHFTGSGMAMARYYNPYTGMVQLHR